MLRLWSVERFELAASDPLGRARWRLRVADGDGVWNGSGGGAGCRLDPESPLRWPALGLTLRPRDLPAILLGRLPEPAASEITGARSGEIAHRDGQGRSWRIGFDARGVARWRLEGEGEPLDWSRDGAGGRLVLGGAAVEVRWKEVARERLREPPPGPATAPAAECVLESLS